MSEQQDGAELKKCPYCGRMTSARANFCWWCARELSARPERPEAAPARRAGRIPWLWIGLALLVLAVAAALIFLLR